MISLSRRRSTDEDLLRSVRRVKSEIYLDGFRDGVLEVLVQLENEAPELNQDVREWIARTRANVDQAEAWRRARR